MPSAPVVTSALRPEHPVGEVNEGIIRLNVAVSKRQKNENGTGHTVRYTVR